MSATLLAAIIGILVILLIVGIVLAIRGGLAKATKITLTPGTAAPAAEEPVRKPGDIAPPATLRTALAIAMRELRVLVAGGRGPTDVPWSLVIGAGGDDLAPLLPPPLDDDYAMGWLDEQDLARAGTLSFRTGGVVLGFEDGLAGQPQAERRLMDLLREIEVIRPDRPLDSLVIVVPWQFLAEADEEALNARGRQLYNLILTVQKRTGWRVPVYVLVSEAERLPGFPAIGRAVLAHALSPMVGWAAPRTLDSVFQPSWVDDAFEAMCGALSIEQLHVLMGIEGELLDTGLPPSANDQLSEDVLLLPARLAAARPALRQLMSQMLENSVYHESFMLRGIFLTGDTEPRAIAPQPAEGAAPAEEGEGAPPPRAPQRLAQLLFLDKIFPESGLAQPAYGERTRRHRLIRRTQIALATACLCFVLGIALIGYYGAHSVPPLDALLQKIASIEMAAKQNRAETLDATGSCSERRARVDREQTQDEFQNSRRNSVLLLDQMSELDLHRVEIWLAPTSYLSGANAMVEKAIKKSFHDVVFNAIADSMATPTGIEALVAGDTPTEYWRTDADPAAASAFGGDFEGYWGATLRNVGTYDRYFRLASDMREKTPESVGVLRGFAEVVQYSLGEQLPPQFTRNYRVYSQGITEASVPCLDTNIVQNTLDRIVAVRYETAVRIYYLGNPVALSWAKIAGRFDDDSETGVTDATLHGLVDDIDTMAAALAEPRRYAWIFATDSSDLPLPNLSAFDGLRAVRMAHLADLPGQMRPLAEQQAQRLRSAQLFGSDLLVLDQGPEALALLAKPAPASVATAPVNPPVGLPKLSEATIDTRNFLRALFAQPFMVGDGEPVAGYDGARPGWDIGRLQAVQGALKAYNDFLAESSGQMPATLHKIAVDLAARRFGQYAEGLVAQAAQPLSAVVGAAQGGADAGAVNFGQALPLLMNIRDSLRAMGAGDVAARLDLRMAEQAGLLLADADRELDNGGGPYAVDDASLAAWDGSGSPALAAYGVDTIDDLKATLPPRRTRVSALARGRAAPLVAYLRDTPATSAASLARANRWQGILQTLDAYDANSPSNSLSRLEQYITVDLDKLDWRNCAQMRSGRARQGDYFAQQQAAITIKLISRCRRVAIETIESRYAGLRQLFNSTLAGRFPFSHYGAAPPADPANVQAFFGQYGALLPQLKTALEGANAAGEARLQAVAVLDQLIRVQAALAPMLDAGDATLSYRVDVDFFPNAPGAVGQSQILGASMGTPDSTARDSGPGNFLWHNGEPVAVRLRWAANAPTLPMTADGKCVPQPGGNGFQQDVAGDWALLRLLRAQGFEPRVGDAAPGMAIAFDIPLCENRARASGGDPVRDQARIFLRLTLSRTVHTPDKPDRQVPVILPPFPESVPPLIAGAER